MELKYVMPTEINDWYLNKYANVVASTYDIIGILIEEEKYLTITTSRDLTSSENATLNEYIADFTNSDTELCNAETISKCELWAQEIEREFSLRNMDRKSHGLMTRKELMEIMQEVNDSLLSMCLSKASLDTAALILFGDANEEVSPYVFEKVWQEDLDWMKAELISFLSTL